MVVVVGLLAGAVSPATAATQDEDAEQSLVVDLKDDGSATVILTLTYDLTDENETDSFESLRSDEEAQAAFRDRFQDRMQSVASDAENVTGREMAVHDAAISLSTTNDDGTGVVRLSVVYDGLAATEDGALVVTEPFASGYVTNYAFEIRPPDGYRLASVSPSPASQQDVAATWGAGTDLSGFEATFEPTPTSTTAESTTGNGSSDGGAPGFGVVASLLAVAGAVLFARGRQ